MTEEQNPGTSQNSHLHKTDRSSPQNREMMNQIVEMIFLLVAWIVLTIYYMMEGIYRMIWLPAPKSVQGEIVLITGTGHGIGKLLASYYADAGATVVGWDINKANNDETMKEINKKYPNRARGYVCNVANRENVLETAQKVQREVGDVKIVIINAGIMPCHLLEEHSADEIRRIIDINVMQYFWLIEAFLPSMKKNNCGHIVGMSSMAGVAGFNNIVPYCASKYAVRGLMESLRMELRAQSFDNIHITAIYPHMVNTGLCKNPRIRFDKVLSMLPPEGVAHAVMMAQRRDEIELSLPRYLYPTINALRLLPFKSQLKAADFLDTGLDSDLLCKNE
ncbi:hypothetical protein WA026_011419 [Henosepilachna vigintioctopunctata]|uniref:Short-chain dehydrogenase/reductase 3 n=1 Tax=Henosepilachna vigintioctopunctata TaxID=420089 RepID=A0AAW1TJJ2_9CUCU